MGSSWKVYEQATFDVFRSTGHPCENGSVMSGVRGRHQIDVSVQYQSEAANHLWVVECKEWSRPVGKAQVQSLRAVIDDLGADHGFLLSEKGFQKGALAMARKLNITLTSLTNLEARFKEDQLSLSHRQSKAFWAEWSDEPDLGNMDAERVVTLHPSGDLSVADHILEVHVRQKGKSAWVMSREKCLSHLSPEGYLQISFPWDPMRASGDGLPDGRPTTTTCAGWDVGGPHWVTFRTLAGPVALAPFALYYS